MGILVQILIPLAVIALLMLVAKRVWMSGYVAGTLTEAKFWLDSIDMLRVPNWQSLPVTGDDKSLTPEQSKYANQVYVSAYSLALHTIQTEIAEARRQIVDAAQAEEEKRHRGFSE